MHWHLDKKAAGRSWGVLQAGGLRHRPASGLGRWKIRTMRSYMKFLFLSTIFVIAWQPQQAQSQPARKNRMTQEGVETGMTVPVDTRIPLRLQSAISSKTAYVGEAIYCRTVYPITVGDQIVIPVGSYVKGDVTQVIHPGRIRGKAKLGLRFDSITLPSGVTRPLRATLSAFAGNGTEGFDRKEAKIEGQSTKGKDVGRIARTTVIGAEIGSIAGISRGRSLKGLGIGSAAGAAGGVIWVLAGRGKQIYLPPGTSLELRLDSPLSFSQRNN
ncbi:MAG: hypothetical protein M1404_02580 [Acidobacteria bacterium]|nr:hypothetical protein [Acidobacteriota bacterium]